MSATKVAKKISVVEIVTLGAMLVAMIMAITVGAISFAAVITYIANGGVL